MMNKNFTVLAFLIVLNIISFSIDFKGIDFTSEEGSLYIDVAIDDIFSKDALDSLENGQEIKIYLLVNTYEKKALLPNKKISSAEERNLIQYNIITQKYHVVIGKKPSNRDESFEEDKEESFDMIGKFKKLLILKESDLDRNKDYKITVEIKVVSLKMSPPISFIFDLFFDLNYSETRSFEFSGAQLLETYFK
ncbi:MAG: DUF4390 domain-containing protein [bacterium]|nr:DUF4390 domain-containing protein [bacterium]